jgi:hypothetical protein
VADSVLGPLLTPERGRELLSTPRGGQAGEAPRPAAGLDPGNLAWLAEPDPGNNRTSYRFVLVEGVKPEELPGRLANGDGTVLNEPMTFWEARHRSLHNQREFSSYDDRALMAVGRAGTGWWASYRWATWPLSSTPIGTRRHQRCRVQSVTQPPSTSA